MGNNVNCGIWFDAFTARAKGSGGTQAAAVNTFRSLQRFCDKEGRNFGKDVNPDNISSKQIRIYLEHQALNKSARTIQNEASHIRRALRGVGRNLGDLKDKKNNFSSSRLSLKQASRKGTKGAISGDKVNWVRSELSARHCAAFDMQLNFGLREKEAVISKNAEEWKKTIESAIKIGHPKAFVHLSSNAGSKTGRPRFITISSERFEKSLEVLNRVIQLKSDQKNGNLIDKPSLEQALKSYDSRLRYLGCTGADSSHGARRAWAQAQYKNYLVDGLSAKEALSRLSNDLGHGDGRGTYVKSVYLVGLEE